MGSGFWHSFGQEVAFGLSFLRAGRDAEWAVSRAGDGKESCTPQLHPRALRQNGWERDTAGFSIALFSERYLCCVGVSKACDVCMWKRSEEEQIEEARNPNLVQAAARTAVRPYASSCPPRVTATRCGQGCAPPPALQLQLVLVCRCVCAGL